MPKSGQTGPEVEPGTGGELYVADIGIPPEVFARVGVKPPDLFRHSTLVKLR